MGRSYILGTGFYVPERIVTNDDLAKWMDTSDEWIRQRSGIERRRYAPDDVGCAELAYQASVRALGEAGLQAGAVDCIILATLSPDYHFPGSACLLGSKLGLPGIPAIAPSAPGSSTPCARPTTSYGADSSSASCSWVPRNIPWRSSSRNGAGMLRFCSGTEPGR